MLFLRLIIYIIPLFIFPYLLRRVWKKEFYGSFSLLEFWPIGILTGLGTFLLTQFIVLQFADFGAMVILTSLGISMVVNWIIMFTARKLFKGYELPSVTPFKQMKSNNRRILDYLFIIGTVWYLGVAATLFYEPSFWWDEIIHWVPKAKILIESGNIHEFNKIPFPEYPRFWPILIADFMFLQDKLTQLIPLILYYFYWSFTVLISLKYINIKNLRSMIPFTLILSGAFMNIGWGAPYANLPLSVFYSTALIILYLIIDRKLEWKYVIYPAILLGTVTQIRTEGIVYSIVAITAFAFAGYGLSKLNTIKGVLLMAGTSFLFYVSWPIYILTHSIRNQNLEIAMSGFRENWGNFSLMTQKLLGIVDYMWLETGKPGRPYFLLLIFLGISILTLIKSRKPNVLFGICAIYLNFAVVFLLIFFSPAESGGFGGLIWWLQTNYTRFTGHYLPFVFFVSGLFLNRLQSKKNV